MSEEAKKANPLQGLPAEEVEAAMLEAERVKAAQADPVEIASMMLTLYTPRFCGIIDTLSNRQLRRVIKSLIEFPVGRDYEHRDKAEREAFAIGNRLMDAKYVLVANSYNEHREELMKAVDEAAKNAVFERPVEVIIPELVETKEERLDPSTIIDIEPVTEGSNNG
jgi:hypothetical protein